MTIKIDIASDANQTTKDLAAVEAALQRIKALSFNINIKPTASAADFKTSEASLKNIRASTESASSHLQTFQRSLNGMDVPVRNLADRFNSVNKASASVKDSQVATNKAILDTAASTARLESSVSKVSDKFQNIAASVAGLVGLAAGVSSMTSMLDASTNMNSQLKLSTASAKELNYALRITKEIAIDSRASITDTTNLYAKLSRATAGFARSQQDVAVVTQTVSKAIAISGSSTESASAAIMQLGQALGSGVLQGDELRSVLENAPALAQAIADGFGVSIGGLRAMGKAGSLESELVFKALLSQASKVEGKFQQAGVTYAQAFTVLGTAVKSVGMEITQAFSSGDKTFPQYLVEIGSAVATLSAKIGFQILKLRTEITLAILEIQEFLDAPLELKFQIFQLNVADIMPSIGAFQGYAQNAANAVQSVFSTVLSLFSPQTTTTKNFAVGGIVTGPGSGTSDEIPAMLSNGEFVVKAKATSRNRSLLENINSGRTVSHFASGGYVGDSLLVRAGVTADSKKDTVSETIQRTSAVSAQNEVKTLSVLLAISDKLSSQLGRQTFKQAPPVATNDSAIRAATEQGLRGIFAEYTRKAREVGTQLVDAGKSFKDTVNQQTLAQDAKEAGNHLRDTGLGIKSAIASQLTSSQSINTLMASSLVNDAKVAGEHIKEAGLDLGAKLKQQALTKYAEAKLATTNFLQDPIGKFKSIPLLLAGMTNFSTLLESVKLYFDKFLTYLKSFIPNLEGGAEAVKSFVAGLSNPFSKKTASPDSIGLSDVFKKVIPDVLQTPAIVTLGLAISGLILALTKSGDQFRYFGLGLTALGTDTMIRRTKGTGETPNSFAFGIVDFGLSIVKKFTDFFFGQAKGAEIIAGKREGSLFQAVFIEGLFGDRGFGGVIVSIARLALLFGAGRAAIGAGLLGVATAPTRMVQNAATSFQAGFAERRFASSERTLTIANDALARLQTRSDNAVADLARTRYNTVDPAGNVTPRNLTRNEANEIAAGRGAAPAGLQGLARTAQIAAAELATHTRTTQQNREELTRQTATFRASAEALRATVNENRTRLREGVMNTGAGLGGAFGGLLGFNIGRSIADGMEGAPAWQKIGVTMLAAFGVQAIGAGIGTAIASVLVGTVATIGTVLAGATAWVIGGITTQFALAMATPTAGIIAAGFAAALPIIGAIAAISAAVLIWQNADWLNKAFREWTELGNLWGSQLVKWLAKAFPFLGSQEELGNNVERRANAIRYTEAETKYNATKPGTPEAKAAGNELILAELESLALGAKADAITQEGKNKLGRPNFFHPDRSDVTELYGKAAEVAKSYKGPNTKPLEAALAEVNNSGARLTSAATTAENIVTEAIKPVTDLFKKVRVFASSVWGAANSAESVGSFDSPPGFATGGLISGPGTGTSDEIPALLSNGEFIVNASATSKHRSLLHAINDGKAVQRFASGGEAALRANYVPRRNEVSSDQIFEKLVNAIKSLESSNNANVAASHKGAIGIMQITPDTFKQYAKLGEEITNTADNLAVGRRILEKLYRKYDGDIGLTAAAYHGGPGVIKDGVINPRANDKDANGKNGIFTTEYAERIKRAVGVAKGDIAELKESVKDAGEKTGGMLSDLGADLMSGFRGLVAKIPGGTEQLTKLEGFVSKVLGMLDPKKESAPFGKSFAEYAAKLKEATGEDVDESAIRALKVKELQGLNELVKNLFAANKAKEEADKGKDEVKSAEATGIVTQLKNDIKAVFTVSKTKQEFDPLAGIDSDAIEQAMDKLNAAISSTDIKLSQTDFMKMKKEDFDAIRYMLQNIQRLSDAVKDGKLPASSRTARNLKDLQSSLKDNINRFVTDADPKPSDEPKNGTEAGNAFAKNFQKSATAGLSSFLKGEIKIGEFGKGLLDRFTAGIVDSFASGVVDDLFKNMFTSAFTNVGSSVNVLGSDVASGKDGKTGGMLGYLQKGLGWLGDKFGPSDYSNEGKNYPDVISEGPPWTEAILNIGDDITSSGYDFSDILTDGAFTEGSTNFIDKFGLTLDGFSGDFGGMLSRIGSMFAGGGSGGGGGIFGMIGGVLGLVSGGGSPWASEWDSFAYTNPGGYGWATGGFVSGPGSGTSDSIFAKLSNGEFVVNAESTKKFGGLLQRINEGNMPHYATGGLVGYQMADPATLSDNSAKSAKAEKSTIINLNITGDISRQTRGEIYKMLPNIAEGVNQHNKERNYRG